MTFPTESLSGIFYRLIWFEIGTLGLHEVRASIRLQRIKNGI
jgi:hypothetical protein